MGNNNNNVEPKRLSANLVDDDLDLIAIKIIRKFRIAIGVIVSSVIVLLSLFGINIIDIGKQAAIYKSESEVLRQDVTNIREHVKSINSIIDEAKRLIVTMDNSTIETKKQVGESKDALSELGKIKRDLDKRLNDLVSCQYLKIREKTSLKVDYFDLTIYVDNMGCWPRFWNMKKIEGVEVTRDHDGEKEVLYDQTDEGKKVSEGIPIEFTDDEYCYKLTFGLIEIGVVERDQAQIKINREKK